MRLPVRIVRLEEKRWMEWRGRKIGSMKKARTHWKILQDW